MFLTDDELKALGLGSYGKKVLISNRASIYGAANLHIGDNVRIDDFVVISAGAGGIYIGSHIHIAVYTSLIGAGRIDLHDFCNLSSKVSIYSSNDDYSGERMTNPTVPDAYKNVTNSPVSIGRHSIVGAGAIILPGVTIGDGCSIGALSMVNRNCDAFSVYAGVPAKYLKQRSDKLLELEKQYLADWLSGKLK